MRVGVLIIAKDEEEALLNLTSFEHCWDVEELTGFWDYPYPEILEDWGYEGNEESTINSGWTCSEFLKWSEGKDKYLYKDRHVGLFMYLIDHNNNSDLFPLREDLEKIMEEVKDTHKIYVGRVHI